MRRSWPSSSGSVPGAGGRADRPGRAAVRATKTVLEAALEAELTEHLGHEHGQPPMGSNMRNGLRSKTVLTEIGPVEIEVPRDRDGSFEPVIVPKRKRRLDGIDEIVLSLTARGLTTGEIAAHFTDVCGATVCKDTISGSPRSHRLSQSERSHPTDFDAPAVTSLSRDPDAPTCLDRPDTGRQQLPVPSLDLQLPLLALRAIRITLSKSRCCDAR